MKLSPLKNQHGAVLAFSLVMLLLLTLASTSMIQQNKAQISIATNSGEQAKSFASVETALMKTQDKLEELRYVDGTGDVKSCKSGATNSVHPVPHTSGTLDLNDASISATVQAEYCITNWNMTTKVGSEFQCRYEDLDVDGNRYRTNGVRNIVKGSIIAEDLIAIPHIEAVPSEGEAQACKRLNWAGGAAGNEACHIEIYTLHVTFNDQVTSAMRTVESKFMIDCSDNM